MEASDDLVEAAPRTGVLVAMLSEGGQQSIPDHAPHRLNSPRSRPPLVTVNTPAEQLGDTFRMHSQPVHGAAAGPEQSRDDFVDGGVDEAARKVRAATCSIYLLRVLPQYGRSQAS